MLMVITTRYQPVLHLAPDTILVHLDYNVAMNSYSSNFCHKQRFTIFQLTKENSMKKILLVLIIMLIFTGVILGISDGSTVFAQNSQTENPPQPTPTETSVDTFEVQLLDIDNQITIEQHVSPIVLKIDDNPAMQGLAFPLNPNTLDAQSNTATFNIIFLPAGAQDRTGNATCQTFPNEARTAFQWAANNIWGQTIVSSVPIEIEACWANLDASTLGYSGALSVVWSSSFPNPSAWYQSSLANALRGYDLSATTPDMFITYNSVIPWHYGTDGVPQTGKFDFVTAVAHEIAHGLQFSGTAWVLGGNGNLSTRIQIYDYFMEDSLGRLITDTTHYPNDSAALGTVLTSDNLFWGGANAKTANNNQRVKMYAPSPWVLGSSYAHLDYDTFAGTSNSLMVYAASDNYVQHNPGHVTACILKDVGWTINESCIPIPTAFNKLSPSSGSTSQPLTITLSWQSSTDTDSYEYCYSSAPGPCTRWNSVGTNTSVTLNGLAPNYTYYWQVRAVNAGGNIEANNGTWWSFTTTATSACTWPAYTQPDISSFTDVQMGWATWNWIERMRNAGITQGCGAGVYCPLDAVSRQHMAIFLLRGKYCGSAYTPPSVNGDSGFLDVQPDWVTAPWIKKLAADGITQGCGAGNYCPHDAVSRQHMAIFLLRAKHGGTYSPPGLDGSGSGFADVQPGWVTAPWIKQLAAEGVTQGCGNGNYCPHDPVSRQHMAIFLVRAFGLP
jgi:hypothetical protein